jgi:hypothetical protein
MNRSRKECHFMKLNGKRGLRAPLLAATEMSTIA